MSIEPIIFLAAGVTAVVAAIDQSIPTIVGAVLTAAVAIVTVVFGFKTASLNAKLKEQAERGDAQEVKLAEVVVATNGMKTELVRVTAEASEAKGILKGVAQAETKAAVEAVAHAAGAAEATKEQ